MNKSPAPTRQADDDAPDDRGAAPARKPVRIAAPSFGKSRVDIIVPFHGQYEKVTRLVEGIIFSAKSNPYRITLVDDGSPNKEYGTDVAKGMDPDFVRVVRNDRQLGFGAALQKGFENTEQPWVMFMHSDTQVRDPYWMNKMGESLLRMKDQGVRLVAARTNNPGADADPKLRGEQADVIPDAVLSAGVVPLYCAMCHRGLFDRVGGFIKGYAPFGYEDDEFGRRMLAHGYTQAVCGAAWVYHEGAGTLDPLFVKLGPAAYQAVLDANHDRCVRDIAGHAKITPGKTT